MFLLISLIRLSKVDVGLILVSFFQITPGLYPPCPGWIWYTKSKPSFSPLLLLQLSFDRFPDGVDHGLALFRVKSLKYKHFKDYIN